MHFDWKSVLIACAVLYMYVDSSHCGSSNAIVYSHTDKNCTDAEIRLSACLNDGVCFVLLLDDSREPACHCPIEYTGKRCQELNFDFLMGSAEISIIVVAVVLLLLFGAIVTYVCYRKRKKLPIIPCRKHKPNSIPENKEDEVEADKMLNGNDKNTIEMTADY